MNSKLQMDLEIGCGSSLMTHDAISSLGTPSLRRKLAHARHPMGFNLGER
jgi:hypothetical protein